MKRSPIPPSIHPALFTESGEPENGVSHRPSPRIDPPALAGFFVAAKQIDALSSARHFLGLLALIFTLTDAQRLPVQRATTGVVSFTD
ncbi:hypothetical protein QNH99_04090 [Pantoea allii]|uniref:hypothetical protein n=1 Tax=Pantoea TaxID=53335 RepID=UPI0021184542|nr:hypothetical protein [Pantoea sp. Fr+CA_20]